MGRRRARVQKYAAAMQAQWVRRADVLSRTHLGEVLLLAPDGAEPIALTSPGDVLWDFLAQPHTIDELVSEFTSDPAEMPAVAGAVETLLRRLHRHGLITANAEA